MQPSTLEVTAEPELQQLLQSAHGESGLDTRELAQRVVAAAAALPGARGAELRALTVSQVEEVVASAGEAGPASPAGDAADGGSLRAAVRMDGERLGELLVRFEAAAADEASRGAVVERLALAAVPALAAAQARLLQQQLAFAEAIVDIGQALTEVIFLDEVLLSMIRLGEALAQGHCAAVGVRTDNETLELRYATGALHPLQGSEIPVDGSFMGWIVRNEQADVSACLADDPRSHEDGVRTGPAAAVPIRAEGRVIGAFLVARMEGFDALNATDLRMLEKLAAFAAVAIQNARLYAEQSESAEMLREQAAELQGAYEKLSASQDHLLVSEKMAALGRITAGIAHEINSPLSSILNSIRSVSSLVGEYRTSVGDADVTVPDHHSIADDMMQALELARGATMRLGQFVRSIKSQTRAGQNASGEFDPAEEVGTTLTMLSHELKRRDIAVFVEMERGHSLRGDSGQFGMIIQNLLSNAADAYADDGGEIWVRLHQEDDALLMEVEDSGSGIPEEIRGRIFDYMFTTKDVGKGTGLGLAMVHNLMSTVFEGSIRVQSEVGKGTTFHLRFPLSGSPTPSN